jgi:short-subunit dehydrogenase
MNKIALVTGASSGIGREIARIHAKSGGDLIIVARSESKLNDLKEELEKQYQVKVMVIVQDLAEMNSAEIVYNKVKAANIEVDYLINNAGFGGRGKFVERDWEQDLSMINVNIIALTALTRLFLADFVKRNSGKILNVSSTASLMPGPLQAVYFASKAYVTSFSNAISEELSDTKITVTALLPGATDTGFAKRSDMDKTALFNKTFTAKQVATKGYNAMLKGKLNILAGLSISQRILMNVIDIFPKKIVMKYIKHAQEI